MELKLEEEIRKHQFCAAIEVTNGVSEEHIDRKIDQVLAGRQHLLEISGYETPVYAGLIFYKNKKVPDLNRNRELDFLVQIPELERGRTIDALDAARSRIPEEEKQSAKKLRALIRQGEKIERLLYPSTRAWNDLRKDYPSLTRTLDRQQYLEAISHIKGFLLEEYAKILLTENLPVGTVRGPIIIPNGDLDIAIAAPESYVLGRLNNPAYFIRHIKPEPVPK